MVFDIDTADFFTGPDFDCRLWVLLPSRAVLIPAFWYRYSTATYDESYPYFWQISSYCSNDFRVFRDFALLIIMRPGFYV